METLQSNKQRSTMAPQGSKIKYFVYCRKSSEAEDRQVQSIDAQKRELDDYARENKLEVIRVFEESKSAKAPGRPVFTDMIKRIVGGEADGLLVWKLNRLARNPIDGGTISWMLQQRSIKHIQTYGRSYYPEDNVIVMAVELGMANQYIRDLSTDTKRGVRERVERGYPNGVASIGYLNDLSAEPGSRGWLVDEDRFDIIRQMLELFLTGTYSARRLMIVANDEMGLRTPIRKKQGGKKLVLSYVIDTLLKNPVYAGFFFTKDGTRHELHESIPRMITEDQYWEIQKILGNRGRPRPSKNFLSFAYVGPTRCGSCDGAVTAEHKYQIICSECRIKFNRSDKTHCPTCDTPIDDMENPLHLHYVYYHCTKTKHPDCHEGSVRDTYIDGYLASYFEEHLKISESLRDWCVENLSQLDTSNQRNDSEKKVSLEKTISQKEGEKKELALMKARGLLDDGEFMSLRSELTSEINTLRAGLGCSRVDPQRIKNAERAFDLAVGVAEIFKKGTALEKKTALLEIGSNLTIKDKKLNVYHTNMYSAIINGLLLAKIENPRFEPEKSEADKDKTEVFASVCPTLLRR